MPTATQFDYAAGIFDRVTIEFADLIGRCRPYLGSDVVEGGLLGELVEDTLTMSDNNLMFACVEFSDLAQRCRVRAEVCRSYAASMRGYYSAVGEWDELSLTLPDGEIQPRRPRRPPRPPGWVEI